MNKFIIITLLFFSAYSITHAQSLSSGKLKIYISDLKTRSYNKDLLGTKYKFEEYNGTYKIIKNGVTIKNYKFNCEIINGISMILRLDDETRKGYPLTYDYKTKKYEIAREEFKAKKTNSVENIILSGILVHSKYFKD
tara:strand:- start:258 stop:671 length:414 start_codon:yes stop_codon:yes gene_type:complete